jgi:hypothetical protein
VDNTYPKEYTIQNKDSVVGLKAILYAIEELV